MGGGLGKKEGGVFLRGWGCGGRGGMHTINFAITLTVILIY